MKYFFICLPLLLGVLCGCSFTSTSVDVAVAPSKESLWPEAASQSSEDGEQICERVIIPVTELQMPEAISRLRSKTFVSITSVEAEKLIGEKFSAKDALDAEAEHQRQRAHFFQEKIEEDSRDASSREAIKEHLANASRFSRQSRRVRPYLIRAIGLRGCGTGGFSAARYQNELWISFGGLGSGFTPCNQPVVIYLDASPAKVHLVGAGTCL